METARFEFGKINKEIADRKKKSKGQDKCEDLIAKTGEIKNQIADLEKKAFDLDAKRTEKLKGIGNILGPDVPVFKSEDDNVVHTTWGQEHIKIKVDENDLKLGNLRHHEVMNLLDIADLQRGSKIAKHRGYFLKGDGVLLNNALQSYGLKTLCDA